MDSAQWMTREELLGGLGDDDEADAYNDETFGDGGWDEPIVPGTGDISDLSAMTLNKAGILQEAHQVQHGSGGGDGADFAFPSLPGGDSLLGGASQPISMRLLTPQMMMQSASDTQDKDSFFSDSASDQPFSGASGTGGGRAPGESWPAQEQAAPAQSVGPRGAGWNQFGGGAQQMAANHYQPAPMPHQYQPQPPQGQARSPGAGHERVRRPGGG